MCVYIALHCIALLQCKLISIDLCLLCTPPTRQPACVQGALKTPAAPAVPAARSPPTWEHTMPHITHQIFKSAITEYQCLMNGDR